MNSLLSSHFNEPGVGLGCMNLSHAYGTPLSENEAIRALHSAFDMGYRHFDTATVYGGGKNEVVVGKALSSKRNKLFLASKCGMAINTKTGKKEIDGRPETLRAQCEASLRRLQTDYIDLYYLHRLDLDAPIEDSIGALAELAREGKIGAIGLSEVSVATLKRAQSVHPIAAVQTEYSLWSRNAEIVVLDHCRQFDIAFVAFSPLARGFLTNSLRDVDELTEGDIRRGMPRFQKENFQQNLMLLNDYVVIANELGCTPTQLALAWLKSKGDFILPIPGTRSIEHMRENLSAAPLKLDAEKVSQLDALINQNTVHGSRYSAMKQNEIDTEEFV
jgi:aryl-alcohol dehydrogenase-like predicted oxidoreductase